MPTPSSIWRLAWRGDTLVINGGEPIPLRFGDRPIVAEAHDAVDTHDEVASHWALWDAPGQWCIVRFHVHQQLLALMPRMRALRAAEAGHGGPPARYIIDSAEGGKAWDLAMQCCYPQAVRESAIAPTKGSRNLKRVALRMLRALKTRRRLAKLGPKRPGTPRVLVFERDRLWDGKRDTEVGGVIDHLEAAGCEVVVVTHWVALYDHLKRAYRTRPKSHLFADGVFLRRQLAGRAEPRDVSNAFHPGLVDDDVDLAIHAALTVQAHDWARDHEGVVEAFTEFFGAIAPDVALVPDENGGSHLAKTALVEMGIPIVGVQHGCIHKDHMAYAYPEWMTPEDVPLANVTCVYGQHEFDLLQEHSIYTPELLRVTGQPQSDTRPKAAAQTPPADASGAKTILFSAQPLYRDYAARALMKSFRTSERGHTLIIRPHPREDDRASWQAIAKDASPNTVRVDAETPLDTLLAQCDVHASMSSTVLSEAVLYGKPNLVVCAKEIGDCLNVIEEGVALDLAEFEQFDDAIAKAFEAPEHTAQARARYIERHFGPQDDHAAERIAQAVLEFAKR